VTAERRARIVQLLVFALGILLFLPSLRTPFLLDDYIHRSMVEGTFPAHRAPYDLYDFVNDGDRAVLAARGILPWWIHPELKIRFFRPLSSLLLWGDHSIVGPNPLVMHLHSLAWWIAAVLATRSFYRGFLSPRATLMATTIFALAPCHALPLAWLANREVLVSLTFGVLGLAAYVRFREQRRLRDGLSAAALFLLCLLGGEYGLAFGGYVAAYELARSDGLRKRGSGLAPFLGPAALYLGVRARLGYGTAGSGFYSDPLTQPISFLSTAPRRFFTQIADAWLTIDAEAWSPTTPLWILGGVCAIGAAALYVPLRRLFASIASPPRWLVTGSLVALVPTLAVVPSSRLLGIAYVGVAPIVALLIEYVWFTAKKEDRSEVLTHAALLLAFAHFIHGPVTGWLIGREFRASALEFREHVAWLRQEIPDASNADVVLVRGFGRQFFAPFAIDPGGRLPSRWRILAHAGHVLMFRIDDHTLRLVVPKDKSLFPAGDGNLFRSPELPLHRGDELDVPGMHVVIEEVGTEGPRQATFTFDQELDGSGAIWIAEVHDGFEEVRLPTVGFAKPLEP
jgi:hypothetical protein